MVDHTDPLFRPSGLDAPSKSCPAEDFISALFGADRVQIHTENALGEMDTHSFAAAELRAALMQGKEDR